MPQRFYVAQQPRYGDRHVYAARTRFIPEAILDRFEVTRWPPAGAAAGAAFAGGRPRVDLGCEDAGAVGVKTMRSLAKILPSA